MVRHKPGRNKAFVPIMCALLGVTVCLSYHSTAIYSYGPASRDSQYGWPLRYGFDQHDVLGEFFVRLSGFDWIACCIDVAIGALIGAICGGVLTWLRHTMKKKRD